MKEEYLIVSWWKWPLPDQESRDCLPEVEEVSSEDAREKAQKKKKHLGLESKVKITKVILEL